MDHSSDYPDAHELKRKRSPSLVLPHDERRRSPTSWFDSRDPYASERAPYDERDRRSYDRERYSAGGHYSDADPYRSDHPRGYDDDRYAHDYYRANERDGRSYDEWRAYEDRRRADYHAAHPGGGPSEWEEYERERERARASERSRRGYDRDWKDARGAPGRDRGFGGLPRERPGKPIEDFDPMRYDGLLGFRQFSALAREAKHPATRPDAVVRTDAPIGAGGTVPRDALFAEYSAYRFNFQKRLLRQHFEACKSSMWFKEKYSDEDELVEDRIKRRKLGRTGTKTRWLNELESGKLDLLTLDYGTPSEDFLAAQAAALAPTDVEAALEEASDEKVTSATSPSAAPAEERRESIDVPPSKAESAVADPEHLADKPSGDWTGDVTDDFEREGRRSRQHAEDDATNGINGQSAAAGASSSKAAAAASGNGAGGTGAGGLGDLTIHTRYGEERYQGATVDIPGDIHLIMIHNISPDTPRSAIEAALREYPTFQYLAIGEPNFAKGPGRMGWARFEEGTDTSKIVSEKNATKLSDGTTLNVSLANRSGTARLRIIPRIANSVQRLSRDLSRVREFVAVLESQDQELFQEEKERGEADWLDIRLSESIAARVASLDMNVELAEKVVDKYKELKKESAEGVTEKKSEDEDQETKTMDDVVEADVEASLPTIKKLLDLHLDALRYVYHADFYGGIVSDFPEELQRRTMLTVRLTGVLTYKSGKDSTRDAHWLSQVEERAGLLIHSPDLDISTYGGTNIDEKALDFAIPFASEEIINAEVYGRAAEDGEPKKQHRCGVEVSDDTAPGGKRACGKAFKAPRFVHKHVFNKHYAVIKDDVEKFKKEEEYFNRYVSDPARSMPAYQQEPDGQQHPQSHDHRQMASMPLRLGSHGLMPPGVSVPMGFGMHDGGMSGMMDMNMANMMGMGMGGSMAAMMGMGGMNMAGAMSAMAAQHNAFGQSQPLSVRLGMTLPAHESPRDGRGGRAAALPSSLPARVPHELSMQSGEASATSSLSVPPLAPPKDAKIDPRAARQARQSYHDLDGPASGSIDEIELNY